MFDHLDDPSPQPAPPTGLVAARGLAIRHRRRLALSGGALAAGTAVLLAATLPGGGPAHSLRIANDPTGTPTSAPTPEPSLSALPTASPSVAPLPAPSPSEAPSPTQTATDGGTLLYEPGLLLPARAPRPAIADCSAAQVAETHPAGAAPPAGVELTARITENTVAATDRGAYWDLTLTARNTGTSPVTYDYQGSATGVFLDGRYVAGRPEELRPSEAPSGPRTLQPGEQAQTEMAVSTWTCAPSRGGQLTALPYGRYGLSVGMRTDQGVWYAAPVTGWITRATSAQTCFPVDDGVYFQPPPTPGLTLSVTDVPAHVAAPDSSFTARLVVTNTSDAAVELVDQDPGHRLAYLTRDGQVGGGWSTGSTAPARTYVLAAGASRAFDVPVAGQACQTGEPVAWGGWDVVLGLATVRDGQPYFWAAHGGRVTYPG